MSGDEALCKCGRYALAGGVTPKLAPGGRAYLSGVATCGKVHLCPVCGARIREARSRELQAVGVAWETYGGLHQDKLVAAREAELRNAARPYEEWPAEDLAAVETVMERTYQGGGLAMLTLTMRHYLRHSLTDLVRQQREAWKRSLGQNAGRAWRRAKKEFGVVGFVRAWECTHGPENGWHPHWHVLVVFEQPLSPEQGAELEEVIYEAWSTALVAVGAYLPNREHGVQLDLSGHGEGGALARYLMKYQDGKTSWNTAAEMTRLDAKVGRNGHRTPFEIARTFLIEETDQEDGADPTDTPEYRRDRPLWLEYEEGAAGIRSLYWSNGLRKRVEPLVELDQRTDAEIAAAETAGAVALLVVLAAAWHQHVARHRGRSLALLKAAEKDGAEGARRLLERWGLVYGEDFIDPPPEPEAVAPTAAELLQERANVEQAARMEVWAEELERQHRAARLATAEQAVTYQPDAWEARAAATRAATADDPTPEEREAAHADFKARLRVAKARA
ncbi:protein rep [Streptomyces albidoflavus]|uniref:protein rep n=1 Tax=Streptomyces albidoflavus TaxID=1886 RepID=UPI000FFC87ED|nr:protein rep [Streptomyces albidoflavus]